MQQHMQHSAAAAQPAEPQVGAPPPAAPAVDPGDVRMGRRLLEHLMVASGGLARKAGGAEQMGFCAGEEQGREVRAWTSQPFFVFCPYKSPNAVRV